MLSKLGVAFSLIAFPFLVLHCIEDDSASISSLIRQSVQAGVNTAPMAGVAAWADGRDITLSGKVATEGAKARATEVALATPGVRTVANDLMVAGDAAGINTRINKILSDKKVEFETGTDVLLPGSELVLREVLAELKKGPGLGVRVEGHTDDTGNAAENHVLSERRAQAVTAWFARNGIEQSRMRAAGFGADRPIAPNTTPEGKAKNRRVEIITDLDNK